MQTRSFLLAAGFAVTVGLVVGLQQASAEVDVSPSAIAGPADLPPAPPDALPMDGHCGPCPEGQSCFCSCDNGMSCNPDGYQPANCNCTCRCIP